MKSSWRKYLDLRAPRYTSYPTALAFSSAFTDANYACELARVSPYDRLSLYVHVPFCRQQCWYCGCNMRVENNYARAIGYVRALTEEIRTVGDKLGGCGRVDRIHFGGGTPNFLLVEELSQLLTAIELNLGLTDDVECAIEIDPRVTNPEDLAGIVDLGFRRISIGVQDFDLRVQQAINRIADFEMVEACVEALRRAGIDDISFDLIYGLPHQTVDTFARTIEKTVALSPERVAAFGYAHLPKMAPRQRMIDERALPSTEERLNLAMRVDQDLIAAGYRRIGFDHYAKPESALALAAAKGRLTRDFQGFSDAIDDHVIGFGASAISRVGDCYAQNDKDIRRYKTLAGNGALATSRGVVRSSRDRVFQKLLVDLLCGAPIDLSEGLSRLAPPQSSQIMTSLRTMADDGLVDLDGTHLRVREDASFFARSVAAAIDPYTFAEHRVSQAV